MGVKHKTTYLCDNCQKEMERPVVFTEDVQNEGCSHIRKGPHSFDVGGQHYCSVECLCQHIAKTLEPSVARLDGAASAIEEIKRAL